MYSALFQRNQLLLRVHVLVSFDTRLVKEFRSSHRGLLPVRRKSFFLKQKKKNKNQQNVTLTCCFFEKKSHTHTDRQKRERETFVRLLVLLKAVKGCERCCCCCCCCVVVVRCSILCRFLLKGRQKIREASSLWCKTKGFGEELLLLLLLLLLLPTNGTRKQTQQRKERLMRGSSSVIIIIIM